MFLKKEKNHKQKNRKSKIL